MGRKSKPPVTINPTVVSTEVPPADGLPPFKRFLDIDGKQRGKKLLTRVFFVHPTDQEVISAEQERKLKINEQMYVIAAWMPWMPKSAHASIPLFEHCKAMGFSNDFSADIVRLVINYLQGKHLGRNSLYQTESAMREFVNFLSARSNRPQYITDIDRDAWIDYLNIRSKDKRVVKSENEFNYARGVFSAYTKTSLGGWIGGLKFTSKRRNLAPEHTSELAENTRDYSDVVMYQLLALFIFTFEQRIGYLKRYEQLTEADMPQDWIYPGRKKLKNFFKLGEVGEHTLLLEKWLSDEAEGYETVIDHCIFYHKAGLGSRYKSSRAYRSPFEEKLKAYEKCHGENGLYKAFCQAMGDRHGYEREYRAKHFLAYYLKKKTAGEPNIIMNQIGWCLANLVMMQTGVNREVVLTIPSLGEDGTSILNRGDTVFIKDGQSCETEVNLYGYKAKTGQAPERVVPIVLPKDGPLYQMLIDYEKYTKVSKYGPFFEFNKGFVGCWSTAGGVADLARHFLVIDESGEKLKTIEASRFRKVFASGALLDRMKNVNDMNELAELLRQDLNHGNFDTTFSHYLLKSSVARSVMDIGIATVISEKLGELKCKSNIEVDKPVQYKKKVFLCHCADPNNPSHDVAIADECRHYDLCLGCDQSVIAKEHLPYICLRILQYEAERKKDPYIWVAIYEDRWCIAHDSLECYIAKDKRYGRLRVDEAWRSAREGRISLPPIIAPTRM